MLDLDKKPRLSRFLNLRRESDKVVFSYTPHLGMRHSVLHPFQAVALALINGERSWGQIIHAFSLLTEQTHAQASEFIEDLIRSVDNKREIISENGYYPSKTFNPEDYLISSDTINLHSRLEAPLSLVMKITSRCKTNCIYCYTPRQKREEEEELSLDRYRAILEQAREIGVYQVNLCGGDGFVRSDFIDIIDAALTMGFVVDVSTKVDLTQDEAERLAATGLDYLQISIDSCVPRIADRMFGRKGHLKNLIESIKRLKRTGLFVRTHSIITSLNVRTTEDTISVLAGLGINDMKITPVFKSYHRDNTKYLLKPDEVEYLESLMERLQPEWAKRGVGIYYSRLKAPEEMDQEEKNEFWFKQRGVCSGGRSAMFITPEGKATLCEQVPHEPPFIVGDLNTQTLREIWNSRAVIDMAYPAREKFFGTACYECADYDLCVNKRGHCFRDAWFASGTLYGPGPYCPCFR